MECSVCHHWSRQTKLISTKKGAYQVCKGCENLGVWENND